MGPASDGRTGRPPFSTFAVAEIFLSISYKNPNHRVNFVLNGNGKTTYIFFFVRVSDYGCVGEKFFEGLINFTFMKRMKRRLQETVDYYKQAVESYEGEDQTKKSLDENLLK